MQLSWKHQFQFAGYYMAKEKGFYQAAGFDVELREKTPGINSVQEILSGRADFGVSEGNLSHDMPVVVLAALLRHSPVVIVAVERSGVRTLKDLAGKRVMVGEGPVSCELRAMLNAEGVLLDQFEHAPHDQTINALVDGRADACFAYLTDEPYDLRKLLVPFVEFRPQDYGVECYSELLITSKWMARNRTERVKDFREASLRGWVYAMTHVDETIDTIIRLYAPGADRAKLAYEADILRSLMANDLVEIGHINPGRWEKMMRQLCTMLQGSSAHLSQSDIRQMLFDDKVERMADQRIRRTLIVGFIVLGAALLFGLAALSLRITVGRRTAELKETNRRLISEKVELERAEQQLKLQRDLVVALSDTTHLSDCLNHALDQVMRVPCIDGCGVYLPNPETGKLDLYAARGMSAEFARHFASYDETVAFGEAVLAGRVSVVGSDLFRMQEDPVMLQEGLLSGVALPIRFNGELVAALHAASRSTAELPATTIFSLEMLAASMAGVVSRLQARDALQEREANIRNIVEGSMDGIAILNRQGWIIYANQPFEALTGHSLSEPRDQPLTYRDCVPLPKWRFIQDRLQAQAVGQEEPIRCELEVLDKAGQPVSVEMDTRPIVWHHELGLLVMVRDISERRRSERALLDSESLFKGVAEGVFDAIAVIDETGCYRFCNDQFMQMSGYAFRELLGACFTMVLGEDDREHLLQRFRNRVAGIPAPTRYELAMRRKDGTFLPVEICIKEIAWGGARAYATVFRDIAERKRLQMEILMIGDWERVRIGQDLHDTIGQQLVGMTYLGEVLARKLEQDASDQAAAARQIVEVGRTAHQQLRDIVRGLLPLAADDTLPAALRRLGTNMLAPMNVAFDFRDDLGEKSLDVTTINHLVSIAREAAANAVRHGKARRIIVKLGMIDRNGVLRIEDDGCGFDVGGRPGSGAGLKIMRYRANVLGGRLTIERRTGSGMSVVCTFGLSAPSANQPSRA